MVGAIVGWVLLGLLALVLLVIVCPLTIHATLHSGSLTVRVRVLFLYLKVYPLPERKARPKKQKKKKAEADDAKPEKKEKKKKPLSERVAFLRRLITSALPALKFVLKRLHFNAIDIVLPVYAGDAADTATRCGQLQAAIGTLRALLDSRLHVRYKRLCLLPDFANQYQGQHYFSGKIVFSPLIIVGAGAVFLKAFLASGQKRFRSPAPSSPQQAASPATDG